MKNVVLVTGLAFLAAVVGYAVGRTQTSGSGSWVGGWFEARDGAFVHPAPIGSSVTVWTLRDGRPVEATTYDITPPPVETVQLPGDPPPKPGSMRVWTVKPGRPSD